MSSSSKPTETKAAPAPAPAPVSAPAPVPTSSAAPTATATDASSSALGKRAAPDGAAAPTNGDATVRTKAEDGSAKPRLDPNSYLKKLPLYFRTALQHCEVINMPFKHGAREGKDKLRLVVKGTRDAARIITPFHRQIKPWGPAYGDMSNPKMIEALMKAAGSKYKPGTAIGCKYRTDMSVRAWNDENPDMCTKDGYDPECVAFVDNWIPDLFKFVSAFVCAQTTLANKWKNDNKRHYPKEGKETFDEWCVREFAEFLRTNSKVVHIPENAEEKKKRGPTAEPVMMPEYRRVQMAAPVTQEQYEKKKTCPPQLAADPVMKRIYDEKFQYLPYEMFDTAGRLIPFAKRTLESGDITSENFTVNIIIQPDTPKYEISLKCESSIKLRSNKRKTTIDRMREQFQIMGKIEGFDQPEDAQDEGARMDADLAKEQGIAAGNEPDFGGHED